MLKKITIFSILALSTLYATAQIEKVSTLAEATQVASKEQKSIMIVFSGSDWCIPCMRLEKEILNQPDFQQAESKKIVLLQADFPSRSKNLKLISKQQQKYNAKLFQKFDPQGIFPLVVLLNSSGKVLATTGYKKMNPNEYASYINSLLN